ncbi:hypothetical protein GCM10007332_08250 [Epilithonimonas arachidiradicis]|uniref:Uncharacterized protein n=1 Tax=Epilithonimonas arachidiradicis TaxID=1617282 RepID=A0ABQ1X156_9FLAO|nr:hypothetical protein GCM10007332_08250 [Epilithonimonas arachidiradicis]
MTNNNRNLKFPFLDLKKARIKIGNIIKSQISGVNKDIVIVLISDSKVELAETNSNQNR